MSLLIIGCGLGLEDLSAAKRERIGKARVLAGGRRLLDWFPGVAAERVVLDADARRRARELLSRAENEKVVVLASGDPLFFGIATTFTELASATRGNLKIEIIPNVSAVQAACARIGIGWPGLAFFNLHGKSSCLPWRRILRAPDGALLLAGPGAANPGRLAADLISVFPQAEKRKAFVLANLGRKDEVVYEGVLGLIADRDFPSLSLLYIAPAAHSREVPHPACGLPAAAFEHEAGLITKEEVRAVILAKLRLVPGIAWDLGAGSGSVAVEAAFMQPGLKVYAVEKNAARAELVRCNAVKQGVSDSLTVVTGEILTAICNLPDPDRVFIGGGGKQSGSIAASAFARLMPGGIMVAAAVTLESRAQLSTILPGVDGELVEINISRSRNLHGLRMLKAENPIALYIFKKNK